MTDMTLARLQYCAQIQRKTLWLCGLFVALVISVLVNLSIGAGNYSIGEVAIAIFAPERVNPQIEAVVWYLRLPSALMAVVVGASLAAAGAQMQTVLNNPLAGPFTLGISAAASFGAALAFTIGHLNLPIPSQYLVPVNAFAMAMFASFVIHKVSSSKGGGVETVVLLGIALVFTFNALVALLQFFSSDEAIAAVVFWTMGSLTKATWENLAIVAVALAVVPIYFYRNTWALTTMRMGDEKAQSFGIDVAKLRLGTLLCVSLLAALPVAFVGTIGFIGLVGPHIARMILGEDQRFFFLGAMLVGALTLSLSAVLSKILLPGVVFPIGVITSLIGMPVFISLIIRSKKSLW